MEDRLGWDRLSHISCGDPGQAALSKWFCKPGCSPSGPWATSWACRPQPGQSLRRAGGVSLPRLHHRANCALGADRPVSLAWLPLAFAVSRPWALHSGWLMPLGMACGLMPGPAAGRGHLMPTGPQRLVPVPKCPCLPQIKVGVLRGCHAALGTQQGVRQCGLGSATSSLLWRPQFPHLSLETMPLPRLPLLGVWLPVENR